MRAVRKQSSADMHHVIARGTGQQIIFEDNEDYEKFLQLLKSEIETKDFEVYAWCLMSNHIHLLVHANLETMAKAMRHLLSNYALYFNKKSGRTGHLFQDRYSSVPVNDTTYLVTLIRYVHQNPVRARVAAVDKYPWSSYQEYLGNKGICSLDFPLSVFGNIDIFRRFHELTPSNDESPLDTVSKRSSVRSLTDEKAATLAQEQLGSTKLDELKRITVMERNICLALLKFAGFSVRQISRLTGIGKSTVQRAGGTKPPSPCPTRA